MSENIKCRMISKGKNNGKTLVTKDPISFLGGVDPKTGIVIDKKHELFNQCITDKILVIPSGKGSTVGSYVIYQMIKNNIKGEKDCPLIPKKGKSYDVR